VLIVGSGLSYHNLRQFGPGGALASHALDGWLQHVLLELSPGGRGSPSAAVGGFRGGRAVERGLRVSRGGLLRGADGVEFQVWRSELKKLMEPPCLYLDFRNFVIIVFVR
jgi:hypothetical protein